MLERLKQHFGKKERKEAVKPDADVVERIDLSRRGFLKCLGTGMVAATVPGILTGCEKKSVAEQLVQNFDFHECATFKDGETKEWREKKEWKSEDINKVLQKKIDGALDYPIPVDDLFKSEFMKNGSIMVSLDTDTDKKKNALVKRGFDPSEVEYELGSDSSRLTVTGKGNRFFSVEFSSDKIRIDGKDKETGTDRIIVVPRKNDGYGVEVKDRYYKFNDDGDMTEGRFEIVTPDGQKGTFDVMDGNYFSKNSDSARLKVDSTASLEKFLTDCDSRGLCMNFFTYQFTADTKEKLNSEQKTSMKDIKVMEQLMEIFRKMPADPEAITGLMRFAVHYERGDRSSSDEYRHPIETLQSGWADCDDYTAINHLWAYVHGLNPNIIRVEKNDTDPGHVFVWYMNDDGHVVVLDNDQCLTLEKGDSVEEYIKANKPGYYVMFNDHVK